MKHSNSTDVVESFAGSCYEVEKMKSVSCYELDIPELEVGLGRPQTLLRIYGNGELLVDTTIPNDTIMVGVTAVEGTDVIVLTGQKDLDKAIDINWVRNPARVTHEGDVIQGDYSRFERVDTQGEGQPGHIHAEEGELINGLLAYGVRTKSDVIDATPSTAEDDIPLEPPVAQSPAEELQPGTTVTPAPDTSDEPASTSAEEPVTTTPGPLL